MAGMCFLMEGIATANGGNTASPNSDHGGGAVQALVYFHHVQKTGGTTLSNVMKQGLGQEHLLPGSRESGYFQKSYLEDAVQRHPELLNPGAGELWAAFGHTADAAFYRIVNSAIPGFMSRFSKPLYSECAPHHDSVTREAQSADSPVFHSVKLVRHPVYHVASKYAEQICGLRKKYGKKWCKVDLAEAAATHHDQRVAECKMAKGDGAAKNRWRQCLEQEEKRGPDRCDGPDVFMDWAASNPSIAGFHGKGICDPETEGRPDAGAAYVECYQRLVEHFRSFLLVGVTERMADTTCLLSYYLQMPHVNAGKSRVKPCRPLDVWTPAAKDRLIHSSRTGWAAYDAANTVLNERMAAATAHLQHLAREGVQIELLPHVGPGCFNVSTGTPAAAEQQ
eukprot:CAMPEP_0117650770 /NCGR_PEP_ID=MMETSP0804-20121206/1717_1 /TAXON_ID=1074897 /ORGANISM="Tetraselmis astigmatica, Strain CCMP880" /LENGTH=393 /DNA_ID=CAMNT_0005456665 /DNA_START=285 /DNA_END=1470 /DNA_ORIENTATION=+